MFCSDDMELRGPSREMEDSVSCGVVDLLPCFRRTYLRGEHDDLQNLHPELPGDVLPGLVLLTRVHEVKPQVIPQAFIFDSVLTYR